MTTTTIIRYGMQRTISDTRANALHDGNMMCMCVCVQWMTVCMYIGVHRNNKSLH